MNSVVSWQNEHHEIKIGILCCGKPVWNGILSKKLLSVVAKYINEKLSNILIC